MILEVHNLKKNFTFPSNVEVLKGVSLEVRAGEAIAIMGKSGEGKSTLLHLLGTLEKPSSGKIEFFGRPLSSYISSKLRRQHIGFVFQSYNLLEEETVIDNLLLPYKIARKSTSKRGENYERSMHLLELVGLHHRAHFLAKLLSGGEKQRVAILRALSNDPSLLLADEPSGNLDSEHSHEIHQLLIRCAKEFRKGVVIATHDRTLASMCDRILLLKGGLLYSDRSGL